MEQRCLCSQIPKPQPANAKRGRRGANVPKEGRPHTHIHKRVAFQSQGGSRPRRHPASDSARSLQEVSCSTHRAPPAAICPEWCVWKQGKASVFFFHEGEAEARGWNSGLEKVGRAPVQQEPEREGPNLQLSLKAVCEKGSCKEGRKEGRKTGHFKTMGVEGRGMRGGRRESAPQ